MAQDTQRVPNKIQEQRAKFNYVVKIPNMPSRLSPHWLCYDLGNRAYDVRFNVVRVQEPKSARVATRAMSEKPMVEFGSRYTKKLQQQCARYKYVIKRPNTGYHYTGYVTACKLWHTMYSYIILVFKKQSVLKLLQEQ